MKTGLSPNLQLSIIEQLEILAIKRYIEILVFKRNATCILSPLEIGKYAYASWWHHSLICQLVSLANIPRNITISLGIGSKAGDEYLKHA